MTPGRRACVGLLATGAVRSELPAIRAALPGVVRRGAQVDLAPLEAALAEAGVRCELRLSAPPAPGDAGPGR